MKFLIITFINLLFTSAEHYSDTGYYDIDSKQCAYNDGNFNEKYIFYDINPQEGFNLRRDVYMRFATMLSEARKSGERGNWWLVLPPWYRLYHWRSDDFRSGPLPWSSFFDIQSLKSYAPVAELHEIFTKTTKPSLKIDTLYVLQNYADAFEGGTFKEKWEISTEDCDYNGRYWGYNNVTSIEILCVKFQGKVSKLWELIMLHSTDKKVMFAHAEIPLHDTYGTKAYWDCRKSMKFSKKLIEIAENYIGNQLKCSITKCSTYISVHWRRQDFARSRRKDVPSITGTAKQIDEYVEKYTPDITKVFVASDASTTELEKLETELKNLGYQVFIYLPNINILDTHKEGGVAIIDQIICSRAAFFIGTHESTFTYRIQEEREILGFGSQTTFNRLCPDRGVCETPSKWTIVN